MKIDFDISGTNDLVGKLNNIRTTMPRATYEHLSDKVSTIMDESLEEVPRDTGALAESAFIKKEPDTIIFGYGGENAQTNPKNGESTDEYMMIVHEDLNASHPVGKAKFLEDPINRHRSEIESGLINKLRSLFGFLR